LDLHQIRRNVVLSIRETIENTVEESVKIKREFWYKSREEFFDIAALLKRTLDSGRKILICGNGGSACDATHFAGELVNRFQRERFGRACISLSTDAALLSCIGNDYDFTRIFARQVQALGKENDVLIGISTSGNSENIIEAFKEANRASMETVALLGGNGGKIASSLIVDHVLTVASSRSTPRIQEVHGWILHSFCEFIDHHD
jgi:D-sedoheptulose 7-phosphate isomerase